MLKWCVREAKNLVLHNNRTSLSLMTVPSKFIGLRAKLYLSIRILSQSPMYIFTLKKLAYKCP